MLRNIFGEHILLNKNLLRLKFLATEHNGWPKIRFVIDNDVIQEYEFTEESADVELEIDLLDGDHVLEIERYGKTDSNVLFVDGQILKDQSVTLVDMFVDNVQLPDLFKYSGKFCYNDVEIPSSTVWGPNGKWLWKFKTPLLTFLIDYKNAGVTSPDLVIPNSGNIDELLWEVRKFKQSWQ